MRHGFKRALPLIMVAIAVTIGITIAVACTEQDVEKARQNLEQARPAVAAVEGVLVAAGQPAAAVAVEAGFRAWEAGLYLAGAIATAWAARKGAKAGVRALAVRRAARQSGATDAKHT